MPADEVTAMIVASAFNHATHPEADMELITRPRLSRRGRSGDESCATDRLLADLSDAELMAFRATTHDSRARPQLAFPLDWASREAMY
jgi:hypothetical protein